MSNIYIYIYSIINDIKLYIFTIRFCFIYEWHFEYILLFIYIVICSVFISFTFNKLFIYLSNDYGGGKRGFGGGKEYVTIVNNM